MGILVLCRPMLSLLAVVGIGVAPEGRSADPDPRSAGTVKMIERLNAIERSTDPRLNLYDNERRANLYGELLGKERNPVVRLGLLRQYAIELLDAGRSAEAVTAFEQVEAGEAKLVSPNPDDLRTTQMLKATSWLRIGEQENCITNHNLESCILPIRGGGVHQLQRGSREGIKILLRVLEKEPERLDARWLLNVAAMTVGDYPDKVPPRWLVPPERFQSDFDIKQFSDVAGGLGVDGNARSGGVVADDFNNDGDLDLLVSAFGLREQMHLYLNNGDGTFTDRTREAGLEGLTGGLNMIQGDYNNDGFVDVLILRGAWLGRAGRIPNSLLRNNGDGTFSDVTMEAGLGVARPTQTAVWFDYDGDGWLDLFVGNESEPGNRNRCELYHNQQDGTFKECSLESGLAITEYVKGVAAGDFNDDGRPDLYISVLGGPNLLLRNDGPADTKKPGAAWKFTDVSDAAGVREPFNSFPCWFFDYDNDGYEDIFVAGFNLVDMEDSVAELIGLPPRGTRLKMYRNRGDGTFEDVTRKLHLDHALLAMGCNFGDLDNDGWLDFYIGTGNPDLRALVPNKMYRNAGGEFFQDVTTSGGFGHLQKGHAIAFADLDNDGDQDVYANMGGAYSGDVYRNALFENPGHPGNHWLKFKLEGVRSNRSAIGSKIKVVAKTPAGERSIYKTVNSGGSFGANPLRQEIGVGDATAIVRVEIFWPATGKTQVLKGIELDHAYTVKEDAPSAVVLDLQPTPFKLTGEHMHHHE
jgi:hypothetical protein